MLAQNGTVTLSINGLQRTEKIPASHDFLGEEVKTLFIGGTKESMDYEGVALPNFQGCIKGFNLNDAPLANLSPEGNEVKDCRGAFFNEEKNYQTQHTNTFNLPSE